MNGTPPDLQKGEGREGGPASMTPKVTAYAAFFDTSGSELVAFSSIVDNYSGSNSHLNGDRTPMPSRLALCASLLFVLPLYGQEPQQNPQPSPPASQTPAPAPEAQPPVTSKDVIPDAKPATPADVAPVAAPVAAPVVPPADVAPVLIKLEDGTPVHLILSENVSSSDAQVGQTLELEVVDDILIDGVLVVQHGATAWATVTSAQAKRRMGRAGHLDINIDKVKLADGEKVLLRAVKEEKGGSHTGAVTGAVVATSLVFLPAAPLFLLVHGKDVTIPKGTPITAFVQGDQTLNKANFHPLGQ